MTHDAAWSLAYTSVVRAATLGVSVAVARLAGPAGSGALGVALQVTALGSMVAAFNLPQSLARHLAAASDPARQRRLLRTSAGMLLAGSAVVGIGISILSDWLGLHVYRDPSLVPVLLWCGPLVIATTSMLWVEGALQGLHKFPSLTRWGSVLSALDLVIGVAAAFLGVVGVVVSRTVIRAGAVLVATARWFRAPRRDGPGTRLEFAETAAPLLGFAAPALFAAAIVLGGQTVLRLLLVRLSGIEAAGHYQAADSIAQGLFLIPGAASVALMRSVASMEASGYAGLAPMLRRGLERVVGWNLPLCLALIGVVPWVLGLVFGAGFEAARPVLVLLATAYGLFGPCAIFGGVMLGRGEVWLGVIVNLLWSLVVVGAFALWGARLGAAGAALAILSGYAAMVLACLLVVVPRWAVPVRSLLPVTFVTLASLGVGCAAALHRAVPTPVAAIVCLALGLASFARWGRPSWVWRRPPGPAE